MNGRTAERTVKQTVRNRGFSMQPHYPELLAWGWRRRFFTTRHIQRRFGLQSLRTANDQAMQLTRQRLLARVPIRALLPNHEHVYVTLGRGLRVAFHDRDSETAMNARQERRACRGYGLSFISHELGISDMDVAVWQTVRQRADVSLVGSERRFRSTPLVFAESGETRRLEPDARYDLLQHEEDRKWLDTVFLEEDRGTMDERSLIEKLRRYERWFHYDDREYLQALCDKHGDTATRSPDFRLLIKTQARPGEGSDEQRLVKLLTATFAVSPAMQRRVWLTTEWAFQNQIDRTAPLDAPIWVRARDLRGCRGAIEATDNVFRQRTIVKDHLPQLRRYSFLPPTQFPQSERDLCYTSRVA